MQLLLRSSCVNEAHAVRFCTVAILLPDRFRRSTAGSSAREESIKWKEFAEHVRVVRLGHAAAASAAPAPTNDHTSKLIQLEDWWRCKDLEGWKPAISAVLQRGRQTCGHSERLR